MHGLDPVGSTGWIKDEEKQFTCPPSNQEELSKMLKDLPDIALPKESVRYTYDQYFWLNECL